MSNVTSSAICSSSSISSIFVFQCAPLSGGWGNYRLSYWSTTTLFRNNCTNVNALLRALNTTIASRAMVVVHSPPFHRTRYSGKAGFAGPRFTVAIFAFRCAPLSGGWVNYSVNVGIASFTQSNISAAKFGMPLARHDLIVKASKT